MNNFFEMFVKSNIWTYQNYIWNLFVFNLNCLLPSSLPLVLLLLQRTSRFSGWRRRICSIGGFLCAPTPPPHPKLTPAPSPGTCLMEETTIFMTSAQVNDPRGQSRHVGCEYDKIKYFNDICWWIPADFAALYLFHKNPPTSAAAY